jgi:hypothetical protein
LNTVPSSGEQERLYGKTAMLAATYKKPEFVSGTSVNGLSWSKKVDEDLMSLFNLI